MPDPTQNQDPWAVVSTTPTPAATATSQTAPQPQGAQSDPWAVVSQTPEQSMTSKVLGAAKQAVAGPTTALGTEASPEQKEETSGLSDIFHGNVRQGFGKIAHAETPHVIAGSPLEKLIQTVKPDFRGAATPEYMAEEERTNPLNKPAVDAAQFIDKQKHPALKAVTEAAQSLTSPGAVAILASTGGLGLVESPAALATAHRLLSAGFSAVAIGQAYENLKGFKEAYDKGDSTEAVYQLTHAVLSGSLAVAAGMDATGKPLPLAPEGAKEVAAKVGGSIKGAAESVNAVAGKAAEKISTTADELRPQFEKPMEPAKPVTPHVTTETPLDDAAIRKSFSKDLSADARAALREHVGDAVPTGSSVENQLMKSVKPVNDAIVQKGLELNKVLQNAPHFDTTPSADIQNRIGKLKNELPGGTEETLGRAIDKETSRARDVMQSSDPVEINNYIRDLDKRINSYTAPEEPLENPADAADATRVLIRRALRDKLNVEIPATKPINDVLGKNLELRNALRKKFGDVAHDPVAAEAQHASELGKGQKYMEYEQKLADYQKTWKRVRNVLIGLGVGGTVLHGIDKALELAF